MNVVVPWCWPGFLQYPAYIVFEGPLQFLYAFVRFCGVCHQIQPTDFDGDSIVNDKVRRLVIGVADVSNTVDPFLALKPLPREFFNVVCRHVFAVLSGKNPLLLGGGGQLGLGAGVIESSSESVEKSEAVEVRSVPTLAQGKKLAKGSLLTAQWVCA